MYNVGDVIEVKITSITNFGAFVVDQDGTNGLIHVSEISNYFVSDISKVFKVGDVVEVAVIAFDDEKQQLKLSYKAVNDSYKSKRDFASPNEFAPLKKKLDESIVTTKKRLGL